MRQINNTIFAAVAQIYILTNSREWSKIVPEMMLAYQLPSYINLHLICVSKHVHEVNHIIIDVADFVFFYCGEFYPTYFTTNQSQCVAEITRSPSDHLNVANNDPNGDNCVEVITSVVDTNSSCAIKEDTYFGLYPLARVPTTINVVISYSYVETFNCSSPYTIDNLTKHYSFTSYQSAYLHFYSTFSFVATFITLVNFID